MPMYPFSENLINIIACPHCKKQLSKTSQENFYCSNCDLYFDMTASGNIDLRLKNPEKVQLFFDVGQFLSEKEKNTGDYLPMNKSPQNNFTILTEKKEFNNDKS
jgi:hypothetical protein